MRGHSYLCATCAYKKTHEWRAANRDRHNERARRYAAKLRLEDPAKVKEYSQRHRDKNAAERVYVIVNPAWPNYVKVGHTGVNPARRLGGYNTGDPFGSYAYAALVEVEDAGVAEALIHTTLDEFRAHGEWFKVPVEVAVRLAESLRKGRSSL